VYEVREARSKRRVFLKNATLGRREKRRGGRGRFLSGGKKNGEEMGGGKKRKWSRGLMTKASFQKIESRLKVKKWRGRGVWEREEGGRKRGVLGWTEGGGGERYPLTGAEGKKSGMLT